MNETNLKNLHILIAEDDEDDAETIKQAFQKYNNFVRIDLVSNGHELITFLKKNHANLPNVILTDFNMPLKNGYEALAEISKDPVLKYIPAFVYSTTINPSYVLQCKALGAKDFLIKPFNLKHFDLIPGKIIEGLLSDQRKNQ